MTFLVDDRLPGPGGPLPVDALDQGVDFVVELLIGGDVTAAGDAGLGEHQTPAIFGVCVQEAINRRSRSGIPLV